MAHFRSSKKKKPVGNFTKPKKEDKTNSKSSSGIENEMRTSNENVSTDRNKLFEAASKRLNEDGKKGGISDEKAEELRIRKEKDALLGKIENYYSLAGKDVPFGLASAPVSTLRKHLEYAKQSLVKT